MNSTQPWYANWFDTPFYHILYKHRNFEEAETFVRKLLKHLSLPKEAEILDLACGKGRHTIEIAKNGYPATGLDLSQQSIDYAKSLNIANTHFEVHNILEPIPYGPFDAVFNLFTSFGYFDEDDLHQKVLNNVSNCLKSNGFFVLDFLNASIVPKNLIPEERKEIDGIVFNISKSIIHGFVEKNIRFEYEGETHHFQERVRLFTEKELKGMLKNAGLHNMESFGNYELALFDEAQSPRLILLSTKA